MYEGDELLCRISAKHQISSCPNSCTFEASLNHICARECYIMFACIEGSSYNCLISFVAAEASYLWKWPQHYFTFISYFLLLSHLKHGCGVASIVHHGIYFSDLLYCSWHGPYRSSAIEVGPHMGATQQHPLFPRS